MRALCANVPHSLKICRRSCQPLGYSRQAVCTRAMAEHVQLHVASKMPEGLAEFQQRFQAVEGVQVDVSYAADAAPSTSAGASAGPHSWFNTRDYMDVIQPGGMGRILMTTPSITSTQEFMRQHGGVLPPGCVLVANQQTSGKGRGNNQWTSPPGCLMFSAARQVQVHGAQAPFINYVVCLAVVQGIQQAAAHMLPKGTLPDVAIKWPNDIYSGGLKLGGALIHTNWRSDRFSVVCGIGLNVSNREPTTCLDELLSRQRAEASGGSAVGGGGAVTLGRERLLAHILNSLEQCFAVFERSSFAPLEGSYLSTWLHSGQRVELEEAASGQLGRDAGASGGRVALTIQGLSRSGFLLATDEWGAQFELTPDGNSLDMMQGLIRRKLQ